MFTSGPQWRKQRKRWITLFNVIHAISHLYPIWLSLGIYSAASTFKRKLTTWLSGWCLVVGDMINSDINYNYCLIARVHCANRQLVCALDSLAFSRRRSPFLHDQSILIENVEWKPTPVISQLQDQLSPFKQVCYFMHLWGTQSEKTGLWQLPI